jgi:hypothetical protein
VVSEEGGAFFGSEGKEVDVRVQEDGHATYR